MGNGSLHSIEQQYDITYLSASEIWHAALKKSQPRNINSIYSRDKQGDGDKNEPVQSERSSCDTGP